MFRNRVHSQTRSIVHGFYSKPLKLDHIIETQGKKWRTRDAQNGKHYSNVRFGGRPLGLHPLHTQQRSEFGRNLLITEQSPPFSSSHSRANLTGHQWIIRRLWAETYVQRHHCDDIRAILTDMAWMGRIVSRSMECTSWFPWAPPF